MTNDKSPDYAAGYSDGVKAALEELAEIFDGIQDTNLWGEHFPDVNYLDAAPEWAAPIVTLIRWQDNEDYRTGGIYRMFLDVIGFSREHYGNTINPATYQPGYVEGDYLADALKVWAVRPGDVEQFILTH